MTELVTNDSSTATGMAYTRTMKIIVSVAIGRSYTDSTEGVAIKRERQEAFKVACLKDGDQDCERVRDASLLCIGDLREQSLLPRRLYVERVIQCRASSLDPHSELLEAREEVVPK
jgi:hypothetical protein